MNEVNTDWQLECRGLKLRSAHILKTGEFSDCTFMVGKEHCQVKLTGHKVLLAMASPVFRAIFYGSITSEESFNESISSGSVISVEDIAADVFKLLLLYIYTDEIEVQSFEKACELFYAAKKYMLPHLADECVAYLSSNLCAENALMGYEFAVFNDHEDLVDKCKKVIRLHAKEVLQASSFTEASLKTVCMMFAMDQLNIDSELDLFAAAKRYLDANNESAVPTVDNHSLTAYERYMTARDKDTSTSDSNDSSSSQISDTTTRAKCKLQFTVPNIRAVNKYVQSRPYYARNLAWKIVVGPENKLGPDGQEQKKLGIYIQCNAESQTRWSCYAGFSLTVICHKPESKPIGGNGRALFNNKQTIRGFPAVTSWNNILDPEKGYIKDDSITVEAYLAAEPPHGVLGASVSDDPKDKLTIRDAVRLIRFLSLTPEEFAGGATNSTLLDKTEEHAIVMNLLSKTPSVPMPKDFCKSFQKREK